MLAGLLLLAGCATGNNLAITYHHWEPDEKAYWMTTIIRNPDADDTASLWRCMNYSDGPACVQVKMVYCNRNTGVCEFKVTTVDGSDRVIDAAQPPSSGLLKLK
jgi:hypothetical protein